MRMRFKFTVLLILISYLTAHISHLNTANAQVFKELNSFSYFADSITNYSSTWIDIDQDYDYDLLNFSILNKPNQLYVSSKGELNKLFSVFQKDGGNANGACYADVDLDGDLDVFVYSIFGQKNYLYLQESKGIFRKEVFQDIVIKENNAFYAEFSDVDLDNDPDLLISDTELWNPKNIRKPSKIYYNNGMGVFSEEQVLKFYVPKSDTRGMLLADFNQDSREDLLLLNFGSENELYLKNEAKNFNKISSNLSITPGDYMDAVAFDFDNDGDQDVFLAKVKSGIDCYRNDGNLLFTKIDHVFALDGYTIAGIEAKDWNRDGAIDVIVHQSFGKGKRIFINQLQQNNYISLKLRASRANIDGVQSKVYVKTTIKDRTYWQYKEIRASKATSIPSLFDLHFGIADMQKIDSVKVIWPDGTEEFFTELQMNKNYFLEPRQMPKTMDYTSISMSTLPLVKDLNIDVFTDYFRFGEIAGITLFYENKGLIAEEVEVKLTLSEPMMLFNSFPMPTKNSTTEYYWKIKDVPAQYRGIITLSVRAPNIEQTTAKEQLLKVSIEPRIGDEQAEDNSKEIKREIK